MRWNYKMWDTEMGKHGEGRLICRWFYPERTAGLWKCTEQQQHWPCCGHVCDDAEQSERSLRSSSPEGWEEVGGRIRLGRGACFGSRKEWWPGWDKGWNGSPGPGHSYPRASAQWAGAQGKRLLWKEWDVMLGKGLGKRAGERRSSLKPVREGTSRMGRASFHWQSVTTECFEE